MNRYMISHKILNNTKTRGEVTLTISHDIVFHRLDFLELFLIVWRF